MVQLLLVLVLCVRGRKPYTHEEGRKLWQDGFLAMYRHVDSIAGAMQQDRQPGDSKSDEDDRFNAALAELAGYELTMDDQGYFDADAGGEEAKLAGRGSGMGICLGQHAVGPTDVGKKHKAHLIQQYVCWVSSLAARCRFQEFRFHNWVSVSWVLVSYWGFGFMSIAA